MDISRFPKFATEYATEQKNQCQPQTFCQWIANPEMGEDNCQCADSIFTSDVNFSERRMCQD